VQKNSFLGIPKENYSYAKDDDMMRYTQSLYTGRAVYRGGIPPQILSPFKHLHLVHDIVLNELSA